MQKRGRAVETQKLKRTMKSRKTTTVRENTNCSFAYIKLVAVWFSIVGSDLFAGLRFELMWPVWMILRYFYESMQRRNALVHLSSQTSTFLFVCVTATSDLICYLFIPARLLIFLATTYVWMNLVWHVNGGFLATVKTILGDKTQAAPVVFLWTYFVAFEIFCRMRCDYLLFLKYLPFSSWLEDSEGCMHIQGMDPGFQQAFNCFFSAHCIGYPIIVIAFNTKYYYKEYRLRIQQGGVSNTNESLFRMLADAIPMDFDAIRMYRRADYMDDECIEDDFLETTTSSREGVLVPIESAPEKPFQERFPNCNLSSEQQLLQLMQQSSKYRSNSSKYDNTTPVASPAENGHGGGSNGVQRRHNGARPSISSRSSRANGKLQQTQQPQPANGRRPEKMEKDEEGTEEWQDSSSSEAEVQLNRREGSRTAPLIVRGIVTVATRCFDLLMLIASLIPFVGPSRSTVDQRRRERTEELPANGKSGFPQATPSSQLVQHSTPPSRRTNAAAAKSNGLSETGGGGGRRRTANGDHAQPSNGGAANGRSSRHDHGSSTRSNGLGVGHDLDLLRDVSRESARTHASDESGEHHPTRCSINGGVAAAAAGGGGGTRVCGVECGKMATEVGRLRAEMRQASQAVEAARLHATNCSNGEKNAAAESGQLRGRIEQLMNKVTSVERQREQERATSAAAERKAAESAARAAELERELQKERVERREERVKGREKSETVSETQQLLREKETAWERESERLRNDSRTKDAFIMEMQAELVKLRMIAKSAVEAEDLRAELSLLREKTVHLEENLAEENKLKQELFRALRNTQAERDRARQYDYSSSSSFYPLSPTLGSPGSNGTHPPIGSGYTSSDLPSQQQPSLSGLSCAAEQAFAGASKHSYSFASPSTHTSSFLSSGTGQHTLFELPMPPTVGGKVHKNHGFPLVGEELRDNEKEPFYAQNCGKFGAPSPASARTTTTS